MGDKGEIALTFGEPLEEALQVLHGSLGKVPGAAPCRRPPQKLAINPAHKLGFGKKRKSFFPSPWPFYPENKQYALYQL